MLTQKEIEAKYFGWLEETLFTKIYDGAWDITGPGYEDGVEETLINRFLHNAKTEGEVNLYKRFTNKEYFDPVMGSLKDYLKEQFPGIRAAITKFTPSIIVFKAPNKEKTNLHFNYPDWLEIVGITVDGLAEGNTEEFAELFNEGRMATTEREYAEIVEEIVETFRDKKVKYDSVASLGKKSPYYSKVYEMYASSMSGRSLELKEFARRNGKFYEKIVQNLILAGRFFQKPVSFKKLLSCFEKEKFSLCIVCSLLEEVKYREKRNRSVTDLMIPLINYSKMINEMQKTQGENYNPSIEEVIKIELKEGRRHQSAKIITAYDVVEKINDLTLKHFNTDFFNEEIVTQWELIPTGEQDEISEETISRSARSKKSSDVNRKMKKILESIQFFATSKPLYKMRGINNFSGYHGHVYKNGKVIFEKFFKDEITKEIAVDNATYVLTIHNFEKLSRLDKSTLTRELKTMALTDGKKLNHSPTWKKRIEKEINGDDQSSDVEEKVDRLIEQGLIVREKPKQKIKTTA